MTLELLLEDKLLELLLDDGPQHAGQENDDVVTGMIFQQGVMTPLTIVYPVFVTVMLPPPHDRSVTNCTQFEAIELLLFWLVDDDDDAEDFELLLDELDDETGIVWTGTLHVPQLYGYD